MVQDGDTVIELTGAEKEAFLLQREKDNAEVQALRAQAEAQRELKIAAYAKLGLTEEEINAIL